MKHKPVIILVSILACFTAVQSLQAQHARLKYYKIKSQLINGIILEGYLYKVNNQSIYLLANKSSVQVDSIKGEEIKRIAIRRKGKVSRSIWIGAATGAVSGGIAGAISYTPCEGLGCMFSPRTAGDAAIGSGILGAIGGAAIGALVGIFNNSSKRIDGNMLRFKSYVPKMKKYALQKT